MPFRRKITLTHEGWYYVLVVSFIVVGAVWRQVNLMIVLAGLMVGPLLLSWRISAAALRRLRLRRHMPECVHAGDAFGVEISVHNMRRRLNSWFVGVKDQISHAGGTPQTHSADVEVLLPKVPAGETSKTAYRCSLPLRGTYQFGPMSLFTRFPLGLLKCVRGTPGTEALVAFPRLGRLTKRWFELIQSPQTGLRRSLNRRALTDGGDFYGIRDWQSGDSRRSIHWRMTAKLGALAVRQFEELDSFDLTLVLDLWKPNKEDPVESEVVETAVSFAATVVHEVCRQSGTRLRVVMLGEEIWQLRGLATPRFRSRVMQELANRAPSRDYDANIQLQMFGATPDRPQQFVVISTRSCDQASMSLVDREKQPGMSRRLSWFCVGDEKLDQYFRLPPTGSQLLESVSAHDSLEDSGRNGRPKLPARRHESV